MSREVLQIEAWRFTTISALAREVEALLEKSNYKLEIQVCDRDLEHLSAELENCRTLGRVKIVKERAEHEASS